MKIKKLFPLIEKARYNAAVWQDPDSGNLFVITREVEQASKTGQPDFGKLVLAEIDPAGHILHEKIVWEPTGDSLWLEDPRALALPDNSVVIGLTAVLRGKNTYKVYPAITRLKTRVWREVLPAITVIETFGPGKNITPLEEHTFLFRPDQQEYSHKLLLFSFVDHIAKKLQDLEFPSDLPWASLKIGTGVPPIWLNDNKALLIFHGISITAGRYIYSLGRAILERNGEAFKLRVGRDPILTPDNFLEDKVSELHPRLRRVVYACGGVVKKEQPDKVSLYVNVGDKTTFEVEFELEELTRDL